MYLRHKTESGAEYVTLGYNPIDITDQINKNWEPSPCLGSMFFGSGCRHCSKCSLELGIILGKYSRYKAALEKIMFTSLNGIPIPTLEQLYMIAKEALDE